MTIAISIFLAFLYSCLVFLTSFIPNKPESSLFDIERRLRRNDAHAKELYEKWQVVDDVMVLRMLLRVATTTLFATIALGYFGWLIGGLIVFFGLVTQNMLARQRSISRLFASLHHTTEIKLFIIAKRYHRFLMPFRNAPIWDIERPRIASKAEFHHLMQATEILSAKEKLQLEAMLSFDTKTVASIMVPYEDITTVSQHDLMGPLLLHELHQTGHDTFAVVENAESNTVVGTITISRLLTLEDKTSHKVKYFMNTHFPRFEKTTPLSECLQMFTKEHEFMGVVYDGKNVCGIVSLEACLEVAFGKTENS